MGDLSAKDIKWLEMSAFGAGSGMYPGDRWENAPRRFTSLQKRGLVSLYIPHNPAHKERAVITDKGRALLLAAKSAPQE